MELRVAGRELGNAVRLMVKVDRSGQEKIGIDPDLVCGHIVDYHCMAVSIKYSRRVYIDGQYIANQTFYQ